MAVTTYTLEVDFTQALVAADVLSDLIVKLESRLVNAKNPASRACRDARDQLKEIRPLRDAFVAIRKQHVALITQNIESSRQKLDEQRTARAAMIGSVSL